MRRSLRSRPIPSRRHSSLASTECYPAAAVAGGASLAHWAKKRVHTRGYRALLETNMRPRRVQKTSNPGVAATMSFWIFRTQLLVSSSFFFLGAALLRVFFCILWQPDCVQCVTLCGFRRDARRQEGAHLSRLKTSMFFFFVFFFTPPSSPYIEHSLSLVEVFIVFKRHLDDVSFIFLRNISL